MSYFAKVGLVTSVAPIKGADFIQVAFIYDTPCVVSIETKVGNIGLLFPEGGQIEEWFLSQNNLFRDSQKNKDNTKKGYFEDSRRVRAQPFRGAKSEGFFCPLAYLTTSTDTEPHYDLGAEIDSYNNLALCKKYVKNQPEAVSKAGVRQGRKFSFNVPDFAEHKDTKQWRFVKDSILGRIEAGEKPIITISEKLHGTSARYGNHLVSWSPIGLWFENKISDRSAWKPYIRRVLNKILWWNVKKEYQFVVGSRRKTLTNTNGFYGQGAEQFRYDVLNQIKEHITPGMTVYGEIVGYLPGGRPIMTPADLETLKDKKDMSVYNAAIKEFGKGPVDFSYNCKPGEFKFYVYRITIDDVDMTHDYIESWCETNNIPVVPKYFIEGWADNPTCIKHLVAENSNVLVNFNFPKTLREGMVLRFHWENGHVDFYKDKCYAFKVVEGMAKEKAGDIEDES